MTSAERIAYLENKLAGEKAEAAKARMEKEMETAHLVRDRAEQFNLSVSLWLLWLSLCFCYWFYTKI